MPPPQPRNLAPIIAIIVVIVVLLGGVGGYVVVGYSYAQSRLNSAQDAYNKVVGHQNALTDTFNSLSNQFNGNDLTTASSASITQDKTLFSQLVTKAQDAQSQIATDDTSLSGAASQLNDSQWLTVLSRSKLDSASARISHERKALGIAKTVATDYIQYGTFYQAVDATAIDLDTLGTAAQGTDVAAVGAAYLALKGDVTKALQLDSAPGVAPEMDGLLHEIQTLTTDFGSLLDAASKSDAAGAQAALALVQADGAKISAFDFSKIGTEEKSFYQPLLDSYNAEVDKANKS
jgi:hypothetical protein